MFRPKDHDRTHIAARELHELAVGTGREREGAGGPFVIKLVKGNLAAVDHEDPGLAELQVRDDRRLRGDVRGEVPWTHRLEAGGETGAFGRGLVLVEPRHEEP